MTLIESGVLALYFASLVLLAAFGFHRLVLVVVFLRRGRRVDRFRPQAHASASAASASATGAATTLPTVTVQLPVYNERYVVERLIAAVATLDYPRDRLQVQVLDDSDDGTRALVEAAVAHWRAAGLDIQQVRRPDRSGYKAGALEHGLHMARGELIAVFDADFIPHVDFLLRIVGEFSAPDVGMVQARWGHLNARASLLTKVQATMLNGHFVIEHAARAAAGHFFNFNGTAGVFRRSCIDSSGGWDHDTLTEDLDLSYRAQLRGWRFVYRPDVVAEAELPEQVTAFKSQQFRWAKGSIQTARKLLWRVLKAPLPWRKRLEASVHLLNNAAYLVLAVLAVLLPVAVHIRQDHGVNAALVIDVPLLILATGSVALFFGLSETHLGGRWWLRVLALPALFAAGVGLCINNGRAVCEALAGKRSAFLRTPKLASRDEDSRSRGAPLGYRAAVGGSVVTELIFAVYYGCALLLAVLEHHYYSLPWLGLFFTGFMWVGGASLFEGIRFRVRDAAVDVS